MIELPPRSEVYRQGAPLRKILVVGTGTVKLLHHHADGSDRIVRLIGQGDALALEALLGEDSRATAITLEATRLCAMPIELVLRWADHDPAAYQQLMAQWQAAVDHAEFVINDLNTGSARERVARLLLHLNANKAGADIVAVTRPDMGAMLGLTTETASRVMAAFKREGLVHERLGRLICQTEALQTVAGPG